MKSCLGSISGHPIAEFDPQGLEGQIGGSHQKASHEGRHQRGWNCTHLLFDQPPPQVLVDLHEEDVGDEHLGESQLQTAGRSSPSRAGTGALRLGEGG
jgi:hypothetical protein